VCYAGVRKGQVDGCVCVWCMLFLA